MNLSHTEALRVGDALQHDLRTLFLPHEVVYSGTNAVLDDVVAQNHTNLVTTGEPLGELQSVGNTTLSILIGVVQMDPELAPIAEQPQKVARVASARDEQ